MIFFFLFSFFGVYTFSLGIPCERLRHQMIWIAKFILDEFVKGYVPVLQGVGEMILDDRVTDIKE